jgi:hypothetical protein
MRIFGQAPARQPQKGGFIPLIHAAGGVIFT